ncbi:MAG: enoyl-CoA hydratase/isomerase family protein [Pseudomonadales bacterium]
MTNVQLTIRDHIASIQLDNPAKHNSLAEADIQQFIAHLDNVKETASTRVLVVTGSGDKTFCAGAALDQLSSGAISGELFETLTDKLAAMPIPKICSLNGSAYGGGAEIGLCCDFRIGVTGMRMFVPAARLGLCYPLNGIQRYVQRLGLATAKRILIASEEFNGDALLSLGYLTHLVTRQQLQQATQQMAERIATLAPLAVMAMKNICDQTADGSLDEGAALSLIMQCNESNDLREGLRATQEKRKPVFSGS